MHLPYSRRRPEDDGTTMANEVVGGGMMDDGTTMATIMHDYGNDDEVDVGQMMAQRWWRWWSCCRPDDGPWCWWSRCRPMMAQRWRRWCTAMAMMMKSLSAGWWHDDGEDDEVVVGRMMATMMPDYGDDDEPRPFHRRHRHPLFICEEREEMRTMNWGWEGTDDKRIIYY